MIIKKFSKKINVSSLENQLSDGLMGIVEKVFNEILAGNTDGSIEDVDKIVKKYANQNMVVAAATSIVPGPLGILGAIPEILMNLKNQMSMINELGGAYKKDNLISKSLLLDIPIAAFGGKTNLEFLQNAENLQDGFKIDNIEEKAMSLGQGIIQRNLKKSIIQFVPIAGPIVMGTWAKMATIKVSSTSQTFFDDAQQYIEKEVIKEDEQVESMIQLEKIKALCNLIESNDEINEAQIEFITPIIANAQIGESDKKRMMEEAIRPGSNFSLDYDLLNKYNEAENCIMELIMMAKRSGSIDELERKYIDQEREKMSVSKDYVDSLL